jgi:beta-galactosidase
MTDPKAYDATLLFGAAYYHEYHLEHRLERDLDLMAEGGFSLIRVGESVWSTWEPRDGEFHVDWLEPILDAAHERNIHAVVGTPTYAVPPWLRRTYPETALELATGQPKPYGMRQDVDYSHPTFRFLAERVIRRIVTRYADHPAVIGWQVDNEPGLHLIHNRHVFEGFLEWLRERYGDVETLNERWGLTYWSHRLSEWADLWVPEGNSTPSYDLAWRRYQATLGHDLVQWQTDLVRSLAPEHHFVTTCIAASQPGQDVTVIGQPLDAVGTNIYYAAQDGLALPGAAELTQAGAPFFIPWSGPAYVQLQADVSRGMKDQPFLVTETNATNIGGSADNLPAYRGQRRQVVWTLVARGARMVEYWHWHTNRFGAETYWSGILGHSLEPGRTYEELCGVAHELATAADSLTGLRPISDVGILVSPESRWAFEFSAPFQGPVPSWTGDPQAYERVVAAFYRGLFDAGLAADVVAPSQLPDDPDALVSRWPVLVVPALYIATDGTLALLHRYAEAGGHLVLSPRTGYADEDAVVRADVMPGVLRDAAGVHYLEFTNLLADVPVWSADQSFAGAGQYWADALVTDTAEVLAEYDHPHLGEYPAITTQRHGAGRVTYVGTIPDRELSSGLAGWIARTSLPEDAWRSATTPTVTHVAATTAAGTLHVLHNWSWDKAEYTPPEAATDITTGHDVPANEPIALGNWDVRVLLVAHQPTTGDTP